jgi:hypothetical protein
MNARHLTAYGLSAVLLLGRADAFAQAASVSGSGTEEDSAAPNTFWGADTNGLKFGLHIETARNTSNAVAWIKCTPILRYSGTNTLWIYLPPVLSRFQMALTDEKDRLVAPTTKGRRLGEPLPAPFGVTTGINYRAGYSGCPPLHPGHCEVLGESEFILQDYFSITNAAKYRLSLQMKVIWFPPGWKGTRKTTDVPVVTLPPVDARIGLGDLFH